VKLHDYQSNSGKDLIMDYLDSLTDEERSDGLFVMKCMENSEFDKILYKRWEKKIYEVYFRKHNRIFYTTVDSGNIYLLHACRKQKNKTEKIDSEIVKERAEELSAFLGKKFI
jgi:phage-related protein